MDLGNKLGCIRFLNILVFSDLAKTRNCVTFKPEVSTLYFEQHLLGLVCDSVLTIEEVHPAFWLMIILRDHHSALIWAYLDNFQFRLKCISIVSFCMTSKAGVLRRK